MEKKIKDYEKFIEREIKKGNRSAKLFELHTESVRNFQHERMVHLIIMLFFVGITICLLGITVFMAFSEVFVPNSICILLWGLDFVMAGLSIAYVKHYFFLENHIQGLYKWFEEIEKK